MKAAADVLRAEICMGLGIPDSLGVFATNDAGTIFYLTPTEDFVYCSWNNSMGLANIVDAYNYLVYGKRFVRARL